MISSLTFGRISRVVFKETEGIPKQVKTQVHEEKDHQGLFPKIAQQFADQYDENQKGRIHQVGKEGISEEKLQKREQQEGGPCYLIFSDEAGKPDAKDFSEFYDPKPTKIKIRNLTTDGSLTSFNSVAVKPHDVRKKIKEYLRTLKPEVVYYTRMASSVNSEKPTYYWWLDAETNNSTEPSA